MTVAAGALDPVTLRFFMAVAEEGSISGAAWRENIATSAVSKRITDLEAHLGTALLIRRRRGVELTSAGHALLPHCRDVLNRLGRIEDELRHFREGTRGLIRLSCNETAAVGHLADDVSDFLRTYPEAKIDVQVDTSPLVVRRVTENAADFGIFSSGVPTGDLAVVDYRKDRLAAVLPSDHPAASRNSVGFRKLLDLDFIGSEADGSIERLTVHAAAEAGRSLRTRIRVNSFDAACRFVAAGLGTTIVTTTIAAEVSRALPVRVVPIEDDWAVRDLRLCYRRNVERSAVSDLFLETLSRPVSRSSA
jgi:DNA-binding transcriptional LysR family regulator